MNVLIRCLGIFIVAFSIVLGFKLYFAHQELTRLKADLTTLQEINASNQQSVAALKNWIKTSDKILEQWNLDQASLQFQRSAIPTIINKSKQNESFKTWSDSPVCPGLDKLLREALGEDGNKPAHAAPGPAAGLPANASP